jgi:BirA family biotin operon repressor/biotin-[acetyl-CoA-carboxylase] ligase
MIGSKILHFDEVNSTNTYLKEHAEHLPDGCVVTADYQSAGKGRSGKQWISKKGVTVSLSFLVKNPSYDISLLPLLCAIGTADAVETITGAPIQIKWPNDLILHEKKLSGILCESVIKGENCFAIGGIGVNVNQSPDDFAKEVLPYATSLKMELNQSFIPAQIESAMINALDHVMQQYQENGFTNLKQSYLKRLYNVGKEVRIVYNEKTVTAIAKGIADNGNLICKKDGEIFFVNSGEASVRGLYGYV